MKRFRLVLISIILVGNLSAQDIEYAREIIKTLSSPEFKGRGYVENGNSIAAEYIKDQFLDIGLQSFENNFFQELEIEVNTFPSLMKLQINDVELVPGQDFIVDPASCSLKGEYSVFVIKKIDLLKDKMVNKAIESSAGKILIIDERGFTTENPEDDKRINNLTQLFKYSPKIPNIGTIILTSDKLTWSNYTVQASKPSFIVNKDIDTRKISTVNFEIDAQLIEYQTQNVIGYVEGKEQPDSFFVVLAHYDHLGKMGRDIYFPGANDNSSGVAMILNLAQHFKVNPHKYSIVFIALTAEEIGLLGAKHYVQNPKFDLDRIVFLINFDLAGTGDEGIKVVNGSVYPEKFELLKKINDKNDYLRSVQSRGAACNSDHCMFHEMSVPCFYIYTLGGIQAYHDIYDRYETLPLTEFADYTRLIVDFFEHFE